MVASCFMPASEYQHCENVKIGERNFERHSSGLKRCLSESDLDQDQPL